MALVWRRCTTPRISTRRTTHTAAAATFFGIRMQDSRSTRISDPANISVATTPQMSRARTPERVDKYYAHTRPWPLSRRRVGATARSPQTSCRGKASTILVYDKGQNEPFSTPLYPIKRDRSHLLLMYFVFQHRRSSTSSSTARGCRCLYVELPCRCV